MARDTIAAARAELSSQLTTAAISNATVFAYEPRSIEGPITITVQLASVEPTLYTFVIRVYVPEVDDKKAQDDIDTLIPLVEAAIGDGWGGFLWTVDPVIRENKTTMWVATLSLQCGRGV